MQNLILLNSQVFHPRKKLSWFGYLMGLIKLKVTVHQYGEILFTNATKPSLFLSKSKYICLVDIIVYVAIVIHSKVDLNNELL